MDEEEEIGRRKMDGKMGGKMIEGQKEKEGRGIVGKRRGRERRKGRGMRRKGGGEGRE